MLHLRGSVLLWTCSLSLNMALKDQPQVIGSRQPIVAVLGDDVILPCHLEPKFNVEGLTVEWSLPDLKPDPADPLSRVEYVHLYRHRHENLDMKIRSYVRRTALFTDELRDGNISLKISNVTLADQGRYRCFIPKLNSPVDQSVVQLVVAPQSDKTSTTEFYTKSLPDPDQTDETDAGGRLHLKVLIPLVVFVSLVLAAGVGVCFLKRRQKQNRQNDDVASTVLGALLKGTLVVNAEQHVQPQVDPTGSVKSSRWIRIGEVFTMDPDPRRTRCKSDLKTTV